MGTTIKFTKKLAKQIAQEQLNWTIGCVIGTDDPDYSIHTDKQEFEYNFTERLEELNINPTPKRVSEITNQYEKMRSKIFSYLENQIKVVKIEN